MSILNEVLIPETGETRFENIKNAVSLLRLAKRPPPISVDVDLMQEILNCADSWIEARKWKPKLHYCPDWDYLLIDKNDPEFSSCLCFKKEHK